MSDYDPTARQKLLEKLRSRDLKLVSQAVEELRESGLKFSGFLSGIDLRGIRIRLGDLAGADIQHSDLSNASLTRVSLSGAFLSSSKLENAYLSTVILFDALLDHCDFRNAQLRHVDLRDAYLDDANLENVTLIESSAVGTKWTNANLQGANLRATDFTDADFSNADLSNTKLEDVHFVNTRLHHTNLSYAQCNRTVFANVDLSTTIGLETIRHAGPSSIGVDTFYKSSGRIPDEFLEGCGLPRAFIAALKKYANPAQQPLPVAISYSAADLAVVETLRSALQDADIASWLRGHLDDKTVLETWQWNGAIFCCSKTSLSSQWLVHEINGLVKKSDAIAILIDLDGFVQTSKWRETTELDTENLPVIDLASVPPGSDKFKIIAEKIRAELLKIRGRSST